MHFSKHSPSSPLIDQLERKIEQSLGLNASYSQSTQLLGYHSNSSYKLHNDCVAQAGKQLVRVCTRGGDKTSDSAGGNLRAWTVLIYLSEASQGAATLNFPQLPLTIKPRRALAVVFSSLMSSGKCNPAAVHVVSQHTADSPRVVLQKWYLQYEPPESATPLQLSDMPLTICDDTVSCRTYHKVPVGFAGG